MKETKQQKNDFFFYYNSFNSLNSRNAKLFEIFISWFQCIFFPRFCYSLCWNIILFTLVTSVHLCVVHLAWEKIILSAHNFYFFPMFSMCHCWLFIMYVVSSVCIIFLKAKFISLKIHFIITMKMILLWVKKHQTK